MKNIVGRDDRFRQLTLPVIAAPMFLVSGVDLVVESMKAGIIGSFPAPNARTLEGLDQWLTEIAAARDRIAAEQDGVMPLFAVNIPVRKEALAESLDQVALCRKHAVPLVITSVGDPSAVVQAVHVYGGLVFHDITNLRHAQKAIAAGVDGLILVCAGAGGHAGTLSPFAMLPQIRAIFDGYIVLAGAISDGRAIRAAEVLGADLCYVGTRFIATQESLASDSYKAMLVSEASSDIIYTTAISGLAANFMRSSIAEAGLDPDALPPPLGPHRGALPDGVKAWKHIWSAGQGVGMINDIPNVAEIVDRFARQYRDASQ